MGDDKKPAEIPTAGLYSAWDLIMTIPFAVTLLAAIGGLIAWFYLGGDEDS